MGIPTATGFEKLITPKKWQPTTGDARRGYLLWLLTERILDMPLLSDLSTEAMDHGKAWEPKARSAYEMLNGVEVELCGFCSADDGSYGCSPDGFVGDEGAIEIKCPERPNIHMGYAFAPSTLIEEYWVQTQGQLYVTGRKWTDLVSYFSGLPMVCERVLPHKEFQQKLDEALKLFLNDLRLYVDMAKDKGWIKPKAERTEQDHSRDFISNADLDAILAAREGK